MMLLTGYMGRVSFSKFLWGSSVGALASLSLQLGLGYSLRHNPAAVVGVIATISTVAIAITLCFTFFPFLSFLLHKLQRLK
jgi:membrane protein DedA with SNARE-associated domain